MKPLELAAVIGVGILGYRYLAKNHAQTPDFLPDTTFESDPTVTQSPGTATTTKPATTSSSAVTGTFPLKRGSKGEYVRQLQVHLGVSADAIFGPITESALLSRYGVKQIDSLTQLQKILSGANAQTTKPVTTSAPATSTTTTKSALPTTAELTAVFNAIYEVFNVSQPKGSPTVYRVKAVINLDGILAVLEKKTDLELRAFDATFNTKYKGVNVWQVKGPITLTLSLDQISVLRRGARISKLISRVKTA